MSTYETISIVISFVGLLSLIGLIFQLCLSRKQKKDGHDEIRRSKTVDVLFAWSNFQNKATFYAVKIVESFNLEQCISLVKTEPFEVNEKIRIQLCHLCDLAFNKFNTDTVCKNCERAIVEGPILYELRWQAVRYLNILESIILARSLGIVDKNTIREEFEGLCSAQNQKALEIFRTAFIKNSDKEHDAFPALNSFCAEVHQQPINGKDEL